MANFNLKMILIKNVFTSKLTFINPYNTLFILKSLKKKKENAGNFTVLIPCAAPN